MLHSSFERHRAKGLFDVRVLGRSAASAVHCLPLRRSTLTDPQAQSEAEEAEVTPTCRVCLHRNDVTRICLKFGKWLHGHRSGYGFHWLRLRVENKT